jgi:hypothetical protein
LPRNTEPPGRQLMLAESSPPLSAGGGLGQFLTTGGSAFSWGDDESRL